MSPAQFEQVRVFLTPAHALGLGVAVILFAWWRSMVGWMRAPRRGTDAGATTHRRRRARQAWDLTLLNHYYAEERDSRQPGDGLSN